MVSRMQRTHSVGHGEVAKIQNLARQKSFRSIDDECDIVLATLTLVGIREDVGRVVIDALGIGSRSDVTFIRDLNSAEIKFKFRYSAT